MWPVSFECDGPTELLVLGNFYQNLQFKVLERHFSVTQTFVPLGGAPCVVAVAPPTDPTDRNALPETSDLRAFLLDGSTGYLMWRGTWHSPTRYPLYPAQSGYAAKFLVITDQRINQEMKAVKPDTLTLSQLVDYQDARGTVFEFEL
jgi:ureidoglycolate hydrolase